MNRSRLNYNLKPIMEAEELIKRHKAGSMTYSELKRRLKAVKRGYGISGPIRGGK